MVSVKWALLDGVEERCIGGRCADDYDEGARLPARISGQAQTLEFAVEEVEGGRAIAAELPRRGGRVRGAMRGDVGDVAVAAQPPARRPEAARRYCEYLTGGGAPSCPYSWALQRRHR